VFRSVPNRTDIAYIDHPPKFFRKSQQIKKQGSD